MIDSWSSKPLNMVDRKWHHFFFAADLVDFVDLSTSFTTPTATVLFMSRTAKRPDKKEVEMIIIIIIIMIIIIIIIISYDYITTIYECHHFVITVIIISSLCHRVITLEYFVLP